DAQLQAQLKNALQRLQQARAAPRPKAVAPLEAPPKELAIDKITQPAESKKGELSPTAKPADALDGPVDALAQAHLLFRAHQYEEALTSFRQVDLKGKKAETRAPVQYLMAICLLHLGKGDEAVALLREAANSRGDEKLA